MKIPDVIIRDRRSSGFTLIEIIGVMAIMAILASVLVPNALRAIDRAAISAEAVTLHNLGEQVKVYLKANGAPPVAATWAQQLATFADLSATDIITNNRKMARSYIYEPTLPTTPKRVLIISSMRNGLAIPVAANLATVAQFDQIWNTADHTVPAAGANSWAGWATWRTTGNGSDFLVIERVNLTSVYNTDLQSLTITLNNKTPIAAAPPVAAVPATTGSYEIVLAVGGAQGRRTIAAGASVVLTPLRPRDRIDLYRVSAGGSPDSSYVLSTNSKTCDFNGSTWIPQ